MLASIFPNVPILALTATATEETKKEIAASLGMPDPVVIGSNPERPNIFYASHQRADRGEGKLDAILEPLLNELKDKRLDFPLTVIYGNLATISDCYLLASRLFGPLQYEPVDSSPVARNRMFAQFHAQYPAHERDRIVTELVSGTSKLRLLFVTVAFGIRRVIHIGVPYTLEEFFQEAGRCGRDGLPASSIVYFNNHDIASSRKISKYMVDYVSTNTCKQEKILTYFGHVLPPRPNMPDHTCCDFHSQQCICDECVLHEASVMFQHISCMDSQEQEPSAKVPVQPSTIPLSTEKKDRLREQLINYRQALQGSGRSCVGSISLCTGFTMELLEQVVENACDIMSVKDVEEKLPIFNKEHAKAIFDAIFQCKTLKLYRSHEYI